MKLPKRSTIVAIFLGVSVGAIAAILTSNWSREVRIFILFLDLSIIMWIYLWFNVFTTKKR